MVANLQTAVPPQDMLYGVEQVMVGTVNFDSASVVNIGGLPAGAIVTGGSVHTTTAFNAGSTNTMNVGYADTTATDPDAYASLVAVGPVGAIAFDELLASTAAPLSRSTVVTAGFVGTGAAASAGSAKVVVKFVVPR